MRATHNHQQRPPRVIYFGSPSRRVTPAPAVSVVPIGGDNEVPGCSKSFYMNSSSSSAEKEAGGSGSAEASSNETFADFSNIDIDDDDDDGDDEGEDDSDMDPDAFQWPTTSLHPLLFPNVVRDIMNKLGMQDIDRLRQVCHVWNEEGCAVLQEKKLVALLEIDSMKYYLEKMGNTTSFPHENFELHMENLLDPQVMRRFWTIFGAHIKFLDFRQSSLFIETLFDIIAQHLPNLERLAIKSLPRKLSIRRNSHPPLPFVVYHNQNQLNQHNPPQPVPRDDWTTLQFPHIKELTLCWCPQDEEATVIILKNMLRSMPRLERLLVTDIPPVTVTGGGPARPVAVPQPLAVGTRTRVARLLVQVLTDPSVTLPTLSIINFPIEVGNDELTKLTEKRYLFKTLNLKLHAGTKNSLLKDFLVSVSRSLECLEIVFPGGFFANGVTFPAYSQMKITEQMNHLQKVKHLTLKNFHGPLEYLVNLSRVKNLTINSAKFESYFGSMNLREMSRSRGEHQLQILRTDSHINSGDIVSLSTSFPLLRVLKLLGIDDNGLGIIYRNLPYISELEIIKGKVTDQGLSGVPLEVCKDMAETSTFLFVDPAKFRSDLFLGSLQYLRTLKLVCDDITDISIVFGIVDCKNLENLTLHSPSISDMGLFKIADIMSQLHYLDIHDCENVSEEGKFYLKEKMQHVPTLILEPYSLQKLKTPENPFRQVGFPYRGRCVRPERYGPDDEYDRLPLRERMLMAMDRRRRYIALRMVHRVGRAPHLAAAADAGMDGPMDQPPNDDELQMLMEMHPMFADDEPFMLFAEEGGNHHHHHAVLISDSDEDEDIPTPPNEIVEDEFDNMNIVLNPFVDDDEVEVPGHVDPPEDMQQEFLAALVDVDFPLPPPMDPDFGGNGAN